MTSIFIKGLQSSYEAEHLVRMFLPGSCLAKEYPAFKNYKNAVVVHVNKTKIMCAIRQSGNITIKKNNIKDVLENEKGDNCVFGTLQHNNYSKDEFIRKRIEYTVCLVLFNMLCKITNQKPPWGMLTGVRPVRLIHDMRKNNYTEKQIKNKLCNNFFVTQEKFDLALNIANEQKNAKNITNSINRPYSLYISIPFCPSRCSYCSFVSQTTKQTKELIEPYLQQLQKELHHISLIAKQNNLTLASIYVGGGTPTAINENQLESLLKTVQECFDINSVYEYTVEAGRPDCTNLEKLEIIKKYGATRISINPQTLNDNVLKCIGRKHTAKDIINCFELARKANHTNINMDIIAGLPNDTPQSFEQTLKGVMQLQPENITVHTLTLKRASNIVIKSEQVQNTSVNNMVSTAYKLLCNSNENYYPYYLYRQKSTPGNLENTGYAKQGFTGLYNIFIMEELHTIISAGAGGVTKLVNANTGEIKRIFNHKYPKEYIERFDIVCERKKGVDDFYANFITMDT